MHNHIITCPMLKSVYSDYFLRHGCLSKMAVKIQNLAVFLAVFTWIVPDAPNYHTYVHFSCLYLVYLMSNQNGGQVKMASIVSHGSEFQWHISQKDWHLVRFVDNDYTLIVSECSKKSLLWFMFPIMTKWLPFSQLFEHYLTLFEHVAS